MLSQRGFDSLPQSFLWCHVMLDFLSLLVFKCPPPINVQWDWGQNHHGGHSSKYQERSPDSICVSNSSTFLFWREWFFLIHPSTLHLLIQAFPSNGADRCCCVWLIVMSSLTLLTRNFLAHYSPPLCFSWLVLSLLANTTTWTELGMFSGWWEDQKHCVSLTVYVCLEHSRWHGSRGC